VRCSAGELNEECDGFEEGFVEGAGIDDAFKAVGGVGAELVASGGASDGDGIPGGHFEEDVSGGGGDFGIVTAHDAGEAVGAVHVGDDDFIGLEGAFLVIEGGEGFAVVGEADVEGVASEAVSIEGVAWVAEGGGDVVGDIDDVIDGALADGFEGGGEPGGAGCDGDVGDEAGEEARAGGGVHLEGPRGRG
jgi:hypothetical protein